jgi:hypothetical protein
VEIHTKVLKLWSAVFFFEQSHHSLQMTHNFALHRENFLPISEHFKPLSYSSFTNYLWTINRAQFKMDFQSIKVLAEKKRITARISRLAELPVPGHIITHSVETRTNTRWPVMWWFARQCIMWRYLACARSHPFLHQFPKKMDVIFRIALA